MQPRSVARGCRCRYEMVEQRACPFREINDFAFAEATEQFPKGFELHVLNIRLKHEIRIEREIRVMGEPEPLRDQQRSEGREVRRKALLDEQLRDHVSRLDRLRRQPKVFGCHIVARELSAAF